MTQDLELIKKENMALLQDLTIARQQNEISELKFKLQKTQAEKTSRLEDSLFSPVLYEHYQKVAVTLSKSGVIPNIYKGKPEDIFVAMAMGYQLGFAVEQSLQDIAVINGRPCLWGDGLLALALSHPACESIDETPMIDSRGTTIGYSCTVKRRGHDASTQTFTLQNAEQAKLLGKGVWASYPARMLQMRARSLAIRDKFADALRGIRIAEIESDDSNIIDAETTPIPNKKTQVEKLKAVLNVGQDVQPQEEEKTEPVAQKTITGDDNIPASEDLINEIDFLIREQDFTDARKKKALDYFKVETLQQLTDAQARAFLMKLK